MNEPVHDMACVVKRETPPLWRWESCEFQHRKSIPVSGIIFRCLAGVTKRFYMKKMRRRPDFLWKGMRRTKTCETKCVAGKIFWLNPMHFSHISESSFFNSSINKLIHALIHELIYLWPTCSTFVFPPAHYNRLIIHYEVYKIKMKK